MTVLGVFSTQIRVHQHQSLTPTEVGGDPNGRWFNDSTTNGVKTLVCFLITLSLLQIPTLQDPVWLSSGSAAGRQELNLSHRSE